jgi:hypothetical protein
VVLGFSERLLEGLTKRLEDRALKQEDQDKEKPKGDGWEGWPEETTGPVNPVLRRLRGG